MKNGSNGLIERINWATEVPLWVRIFCIFLKPNIVPIFVGKQIILSFSIETPWLVIVSSDHLEPKKTMKKIGSMYIKCKSIKSRKRLTYCTPKCVQFAVVILEINFQFLSKSFIKSVV